MMIKYKLSEVAKDFGFSNKAISEILGKYLKAPRSNAQALNEDELNVVFESLTQTHQIDDIKRVFELAKAEKEQKTQKQEKEAAKPAAAKHDGKKQESKPAQNNNQPRREHGKPAQQPQKEHTEPQHASQPESAPSTKGPKVRYVDTRGSSVNLEKYDERLDTLSPEDTDKIQNASGKQKIKQNSQKRQQYNSNKRRQEEQEKMRRLQAQAQAKKAPLKVMIPEEISVGELALRLKKTAAVVIKELMKIGVMASVSENIDFDTASLVAMELGATVEKEVVVTIEERLFDESADREEDLVERAPVVVVMGHVDHGKTSLLDAIRNTNVASGEAGGITQHIGAYRVKVNGKEITFLDTPGHAAFTSMRARGAQVTDIAILVVAADDGIMPQTIEAINHAKAAGVPIIVAVNKMDKHGANPDRILTQLTEHGLTPAEWGGETEVCRISAKTGMGIDDLLETVILTAEMQELKANPNRAGKGSVIEARLDKTRGPIATLLVQNGTLHQGDIIIAGTAVGRVRVMTNDKGQQVKDAGPSIPVEITGLTEVPTPGDEFSAVADERMARQLVEQRKQKIKDDLNKLNQKVTLESLFSKLKEGEMKELNLIVKADVQGSAEAVKASLEKLSNEEVRVKVIHAGVGAINESDILLASTSNAIVVGFNVRPNEQAQAAAKRDKVDMRMYRVIYDAINEIGDAMKGMLAPKYREVVIGHAEVRQTYKVSSVGTVAGCYVKDGKITRDAQVRVLRDNIVIHEGVLGSLQRFKDSVKEVAQNYECGMSIDKFNDIKEGDIFECFVMEQIKPE